MGTRSLTLVKMDGKLIVRQYCQWDGYPSGVGKDIAKFIQKTMKLKKFRAALKNVRFLKAKEQEAKVFKILGHNKDLITLDESDKLKKALPEIHRDTGPLLLTLIQSGKAKEISDGGPFNKNSWCEYAYTIDVTKQTVKVQYGFGAGKSKTYKFKDFTVKAMKDLEKKLNDDYQ